MDGIKNIAMQSTTHGNARDPFLTGVNLAHHRLLRGLLNQISKYLCLAGYTKLIFIKTLLQTSQIVISN